MLLGECCHSRAGAGKIQDEPEASYKARKSGNRQKSKNDMGMSKGHRSWPERVPGQGWDI